MCRKEDAVVGGKLVEFTACKIWKWGMGCNENWCNC